jgi:hypothetical protein
VREHVWLALAPVILMLISGAAWLYSGRPLHQGSILGKPLREGRTLFIRGIRPLYIVGFLLGAFGVASELANR